VGGSWGQSSAPLVAKPSMRVPKLGFTTWGTLSAVGRRTTSHKGQERALAAPQDR